MANNPQPPGSPGIDAHWSPGKKDAVGTALSDESSSVWFTLSQGILTEVFYPAVDTPSIRDMGFIVTDGDIYFSEEHLKTDSKVEWLSPGIPAYKVTNTAEDGSYVITKRVVSDPDHDCVLQHTSFVAQGPDISHRLYVLIAPRLGGLGKANNAYVVRHGKQTLLVAERENCALALACSTPFIKASAGFVGTSDGWQDLNQHKQLTWQYKQALNGNVALTGEIDLKASSGEFTLALGFGSSAEEAIITALDSLGRNFKDIEDSFVSGWQRWLSSLPDNLPESSKISLSVLKCHESKSPAGGIIAGLASPWGFAQGDNDRNGYHVVWTRDMVESAGGLIAAGVSESLLDSLNFLKQTQQTDGHWPQNMWTDGTPYWTGIQMDETALPILLINIARREKIITDKQVIEYWPMVKKASSFLLMNGPVTQQDRWEEDPGYTPFTLAAEIAALLAAAEMADLSGETEAAAFIRETADSWYDSIDDWLYTTETDWCKQYDVDGYYARIVPIKSDKLSRFQQDVHVMNVPPAEANMPAANLISPDALALVRFGLRKPDDSRIVNTVKIIDQLLKIDTPSGTTWHRYNDDGYGEHENGEPFDGTGIGRGWPLLTGERAHYELAAGNRDYANILIRSLEKFASDSGLFPEQVWDSEDIPEHGLYIGKATGSATPLAWAHAEYIKLLRSLKDGKIFDLPPQTVNRYLVDKTVSPRRSWRFNNKLRKIESGKSLRIETLSPSTIHWSEDNWKTSHDADTTDTGLGVHIADLPTSDLSSGQKIEFTFYWGQSKHWENRNFVVEVS